MRRHAWALLVAPLLGCAPKPGDTCTIDRHVCLDDKTLLACNSGAYVKAPCPGGCADPGNGKPLCNFAGASDGDACAGTDHEKSACTKDKKSRLRCANAHLAAENCKGPRQCVEADSFGDATCDRSFATVGDFCAPDVAATSDDKFGYACEHEGTNQLICRAGKWVVSQPCRECVVQSRTAVCMK